MAFTLLFAVWLMLSVLAVPINAEFKLTKPLLRPLGGWLSDRFGARPVTYGVFVGMGLVCIPLAAPRGSLGFDLRPGVFTFFVVLLGMGKTSVYKYIPEYFPRDVGVVGGLVDARASCFQFRVSALGCAWTAE